MTFETNIRRFGIEGSVTYEQIFHTIDPGMKTEKMESKVHFNAEQHTVALEHPESEEVVNYYCDFIVLI